MFKTVLCFLMLHVILNNTFFLYVTMVTKLGANRLLFHHPEENFEKCFGQGHLGDSVVEHLPLAQVMILGSWDGVQHQAPHRELASPSIYVSASLCVSHE